jgi:hypothetical protein
MVCTHISMSEQLVLRCSQALQHRRLVPHFLSRRFTTPDCRTRGDLSKRWVSLLNNARRRQPQLLRNAIGLWIKDWTLDKQADLRAWNTTATRLMRHCGGLSTPS